MTDPDPRRTAGLDTGGGVRPGDTPPAESSTTKALGPPEPPALRRAWGPVPLALILAITIIIAALFIAMAAEVTIH